MSLASKRIIITGGARGIGRAVVLAYAKEGATITSMDVLDDIGTQTAAEANTLGSGTVSYAHVDIADKNSVKKAFEDAAKSMGGLDVMVNVAGIHKHAPANDVPEDLLERLTRINIFGTIYTNGVAFDLMKSNSPPGGAIINFGSEAGLTSEYHNTVYGMTKGAVHTWTRSIAREFGPSGVRVNAVLPMVSTQMYEDFRAALPKEELEKHDILVKEQFPLSGRFGDAEKDLAPVLVFLAGDASHFITGQLLPVDGGFISVR